jgi:predicted heme/steroid binding protein
MGEFWGNGYAQFNSTPNPANHPTQSRSRRDNDMDQDEILTINDLRRFDGETGPMYIAYLGVVYDVSDCPHWRTGLHEGQHFPGQDLTGEILDAPHGQDVLSRPCVRRIGRLAG